MHFFSPPLYEETYETFSRQRAASGRRYSPRNLVTVANPLSLC